MIIYGIDGKKLLDAILTEGAEHEQELSKSDFVKLSWDSDVKTVIPAGAYIVPFADGLKYRLLDSYAPTETDKGFKYEPQFHHPLMLLSRIPFLYSTTDSDKNPIKQQEWSFDGLTADALKLACDAINEALGITTESEKFTFTLCGTVDSSISFSVSSNDILSVLSSMAQACKENNCEWHLSWEHKALYFGQVSVNLGEEVPTLKVHDNIQKASVGNSKENYYNCFYPQGSTKNMSRKAQVGTGNVATLARLGLDTTKYPDGCIYIGTDGEFITKVQFETSGAIKQTLALSFDDIYPHIDLYAYNIRKRTRWLKNDTTGEYEKNPDGTNKIYTVWYMRLAYCTTTKDNTKTLVNTTTDKDAQGHTVTHYWYDYDLDKKKQVLQGYTLKGTFKVNTHATNNQYDALSQSLVGQPNGQDGFELYFNERNETLPASETTGDSGMSVLKGDYEIKFYQSGDTIIPTNESDGLYPRGNTLPDLTCNIVILFNIVMGNAEKTTAQEELATRTIKEINRRTQDNNNYTAPSDPTKFAKKNPNLYIGQKVTYNDGSGYQLSTRVIKLVTKIDFPIIQDITVGNQAIKGTISQLKEDVATIMSGNWSGGGLSYAQVNALLKNYDGNAKRTFLRKDADDTTGHKLTMGAAEVKGETKLDGGVSFGDGTYGISKEGVATLAGAVADYIRSHDFHAGTGKGFDGTGFGLTKNTSGKYTMELDNLIVRMKMIIAELEVHEMTFIGGAVVLSPCGNRMDMVERYNAAGGKIADSDKMTAVEYYRCYFLASDGTQNVKNEWTAGQLARCKTNNITQPGNYKDYQNQDYWRLCVGVSSDPVTIAGKQYHYVDLSNSSSAQITLTDKSGVRHIVTIGGVSRTLNSTPAAGDKVIGLGHAWDAERQNCALLSVASDDMGWTLYKGITHYDLPSGCIVNKFSISETIVTTDHYTLRPYAQPDDTTTALCMRGAYKAENSYGHNDLVSHAGRLWLCTVRMGDTVTGKAPGTDDAAGYWEAYTIKGDKGDRGDKGIAGTNGTDGAPATVYTIEPWGSVSASGTLKDANTVTVTVKGNVKAYKTTGDRKEEYSSQPQSWRLSIGGTNYDGTATFNNNASNNIISFSLTQDYSISGTVPGSANIALFSDSSHSKQLASLIVPVSLNPGAIQDINAKLGTIQNTTTNMQNTVNGMHGTIETIRQGQGKINLKVQDLQNGGIDTGKPHTSSQVDFRMLDSNNFYPVMIFANDEEGLRRTVEISRPLDAAYGTGKSYMTHGGGFSFRLVFSDIGNKWGSFEAGQLRIESISQFWTAPSDTPICPRIAQYFPFSFMVAWLRGGSKYDISVDCADAYISGIWPYMMQVASNPSWVPDAVMIAPDSWTAEQVNAQGWNPYNLLKHDSGGFYADTDHEHLYRFGSITAGITLAIVGQPKDSKQWFVATWRITSVIGSKIYVDTSTYGLLWQTQNPLGIRMNLLGYIKKGVSYSKSTWDSEKGFGTSESLDNTAVHANWVVPSSILVIGKESSATNGVYRDRAVLETVKTCSEGSSVSFYSGTYFDVSPLYGTDGRRNVKPDLLATGVDIKSHRIVATADNFTVRNNSGDQTFSIDRDGNIAGSGNASFRGKVYASGGEFTGTVTAAKIYGAYINGGSITGTTVTGSSFTSTSADGKSVTKITGGQLTTGTTNKLIIDTPGNEPGGVLRITQGSDDVVKLGVTDATGKAYADIKGAWENETIARNICAGPYLMLGQWAGRWHGEDRNLFAFLSKNFMYVKHIDAEFLNAGGMRMTPVTLTDIDFSNYRRLKDIDEAYMQFHGYSQYNHPSELYFWNSSEITFDLGDPAEHDDLGLVKNAGRILFIWQMGARIIFKGTPNPTSGNTAACMYLGRKIRGETSIDSDCLGQLNILMSDGKHWVMHYMND